MMKEREKEGFQWYHDILFLKKENKGSKLNMAEMLMHINYGSWNMNNSYAIFLYINTCLKSFLTFKFPWKYYLLEICQNVKNDLLRVVKMWVIFFFFLFFCIFLPYDKQVLFC